MTIKKNDHDDSADLCKRAKEIAREKAAHSPLVRDSQGSPETLEARSSKKARRTLEELRAHQIDLEMQNEELRRAQAELDAARARYFDLYELAPGGYCTLSEQGLILEANLATATLLGVARSALVKKALSRFILRKDQDIYFRHHIQLFETGAPQVYELRMLRRESPHFMARVEATVAQDADGRRVCRIVVSDITAPNIIKEAFRRKAKDLQEKNEVLTRLTQAVSHDPQSLPVRSREGPVGILLLEDDPAHAEAVQLAFLNSGMRVVVHWAKNLADYQALVAAHTPDIAIVDLHLPNGNAAYVLTSPPEAGPFPILIMTGYGDERVAVEAIKAGAIDYLEKSSGAFAALPHAVERSLREWDLLLTRKRTVEALCREKENFKHSLDDSPLGVRIATADGTTLYANRAILEMYHYDSLEELRKTSVEKRYTPESFVEFQKRLEIRRSGHFGPSEYEIDIVRKNGEVRHLQVLRKEILWDDKKQSQALYRDVTEEKRRSEALRQFEATIQAQTTLLKQQSASVKELIDRLTRSRADLGASNEALKANKDDLARFEKLAFTGRIAASIAHEIRNPLTNIILSLRQLKKNDKIKPEGLNYTEIMERNSKRIEYLIVELLNCARPIKLNLRPWNIHWIIEDVLNLLKVRLKTQRIKVIKNLTPHPLILLADKEYLERVFLNILVNAIEAMGSGGVLSIATKKEESTFVIKIKDNGRGIPEKNLIRIFDPFFSTKKQGAGLGLTTCQNIVTSHWGQIAVESAWGKGSVFTVSLPLEPKSLAGEEILKERHDGGTS
ncbi:PAS domain S-box protein [Candidatus Bathyarchaeota archaeon]|nr:PAS domain S-box protein [Candidatus Bathyarchaeota archaeon]